MAANYDDLYQYVFARMPVRTACMGRDSIKRLVDDLAYKWPVRQLTSCMGEEDRQRLVLRRLRERTVANKRYGSVLLLFALSTVISLIFQWWLHHRHTTKALAVGVGEGL